MQFILHRSTASGNVIVLEIFSEVIQWIHYLSGLYLKSLGYFLVAAPLKFFQKYSIFIEYKSTSSSPTNVATLHRTADMLLPSTAKNVAHLNVHWPPLSPHFGTSLNANSSHCFFFKGQIYMFLRGRGNFGSSQEVSPFSPFSIESVETILNQGMI